MMKVLSLALVMLAVTACSSSGGTRSTPATKVFSLSWTPSTETENGQALTDLSGYRIEYGTGSTFASKLSVPVTLNKYALQLPSGSYSFRVVAVSPSKGESASNIVLLTK